MQACRTGTKALPGIRAARTLASWAALAGGLVLISPPANGQPAATALSQTPLFVSESLPPLNMLVMGRDHKLYYEAYNDASDLDGDGVIDVRYKPDQIDYYGYFNNNVCYNYAGGVFTPARAGTGDRKKKCSGNWSGDFLNYLATSRMDAIRRVLYGGTRVVDSADKTVLQAAYIPRDAHTWGKAYDFARDGAVYDIADYAPLSRPASKTRHLFAVTTLGEDSAAITQLRVLNDSSFEIWDWVSQEAGKLGLGQSNCSNEIVNSCIRGSSKIVGYNLRVEVCPASNAALREASCKAYGTGTKTVYKPTGLLHDFGENEKMYFGLLTGSYQKNIAGGVLRRNIGKFADEIDPQTGQFKRDVNGIVSNIDRLRLIDYKDFKYAACGWIADGPISQRPDPSICSMWGNPIGEMMFETLRYFSGAGSGHPLFDQGDRGKDASVLGFSKVDWKAPYSTSAEGGAGYQHCARPVMTVISDINPSYDGKLPGSRYANVTADASALNGFNVSSEVAAIGSEEGIHDGNFFIGQSTKDNADGTPSVKTIGDLSWARGLSPEEPSKEGTYYSAGVARFGARNAIFGNGQGKSALSTYTVAIASPLPEIRFPVGGGRYVTIVPFAKSVTGGGVKNEVFAPTNQIVDYYVYSIVNTGNSDTDSTVNGGRPYAQFGINYEDVEQGADHDMDAFAIYTVAMQADGKIRVNMDSGYAKSNFGQHMGYVISGTTKDGMYLEIRDLDTSSVFYRYNTPKDRDPGYCKRNNLSNEQKRECSTLPSNASRVFTPSNVADSGSFLKGPLWYAAKYGIPGRDPALATRNPDGSPKDPDNYFLVTNAGTLKEQLTKAFNDILQSTNSVTAASVDMPTASLDNGASVFRTSFEADGWSGDVIRETIAAALPGAGSSAGARTTVWSAADLLSQRSPGDRKIYFADQATSGMTLRPFDFASIGRAMDTTWLAALNTDPVTGTVDGKAQKRIGFLRGEAHDDLRKRKLLETGRPNVLGDIVNSSLVRTKAGLYNAAMADQLEGRAGYADFAASQAEKDMLYVGANDGMLHAFNAVTGQEAFAFIPSAVKNSLGILTSPTYGKSGGEEHRYFVDGTPVVSDVYFGNAWHRILIGSLGAGGRQIFALDVTDPASPRILWEFGFAQRQDMGYSVPTPTVARLNDSGENKGKWVVFVPNGYQGASSASGVASLFVLDAANGSVIRSIDLAGGMTEAELRTSLPLGNGLSRMAVVDNNRDGKVDMAYAGDLAGNVWRVDLSDGSASAWKAQRFFTARDDQGRRQAITAAPYVVRHPSGKGDVVIVATGRFLTKADKESAQRQTVFGIWDRYSTPTVTAPQTLPTASKGRADFQAQAFTETSAGSGLFSLSANAFDWYANARGTEDADVAKWGWYVDLPRSRERVIYDMMLYGEGLVLTSVRTTEDACSSDMSNTLYAIDARSGGKTKYVVFDVDGDGRFTSTDNVGGKQINGIDKAVGRPSIGAGSIYGSDGKKALGINSGVDTGRQSWRRQPPNASPAP